MKTESVLLRFLLRILLKMLIQIFRQIKLYDKFGMISTLTWHSVSFSVEHVKELVKLTIRFQVLQCCISCIV